jgi:predicted alpha-1,2-mannosidase
MKRLIYLIGILLYTGQVFAQNTLTQYVNPFVGTDATGHTFPGATIPFAMVQLSPDTRIDGSWNGCSGYHYSDSFIYGFSHTHLSGTGCSDYGDVSFLPSLVDKTIVPIESEGKLFQTFSKKSEKASPGYYSVQLNNGIHVELTSTTRVGLQKYTYSKDGFATITLDLQHRDELLEGKIIEIDKSTFSGFRRSKAWAQDQLVYFYFKVSKKAQSVKIITDSTGQIRMHLSYRVLKGESIYVKTALSSVDEEGAKNNLHKELNHWNFKKVKSSADSTWNSELSKIQTFGGTEFVKKNFYTAMYHCMMHPNVMNDVDGRYRGRDKQVHLAAGFNYYTVFSLWDTYRALHPLLNLIDKKRSHDFMMTFKAQYEQSGRLPMWELWGNETNCMIGFHSVSVIWNAYKQDVITNDELMSLWPAIEAEARSNRFGLDIFRKKGYLAVEDESESVSKTLEYSFNMHCVYMISNVLFGRNNPDFRDLNLRFLEYGWLNLYNPKNKFMQPISNGNWISNFDPYQVNNHFTEANAWHYRFAVQAHSRLIFNDILLSEMFNANTKTTGRVQVDITGLIGQYAHGNEPSHHVSYMFDSHDSINKYVGQICRDFYKPTPDGLCGNEDCGQMSAWYVFSAMGFYPVNPASQYYRVGAMLFDSIKINSEYTILNSNYLKGGKDKVRTIHSVTFKSPSRISIPYELIDLNFENTFVDGSFDNNLNIGKAPIIMAESQVFNDSISIEIEPFRVKFENKKYSERDVNFRYTTDTSLPMAYWKSANGNQKFTIYDNTYIRANQLFFTTYASFHKRPNNYSVHLNCTYNKQYTAGGPDGLLDGLKGDLDWRKGRWQGYQSQDFEAVIDMKQEQKVDSVTLGFLRDKRSWIFLPKGLEVYGSTDSIKYKKISEWQLVGMDTGMTVERVTYSLQGNNKKYRYLKIRAINYGKLPDWHPGRGEDAFIFIDEISIKSKK